MGSRFWAVPLGFYFMIGCMYLAQGLSAVGRAGDIPMAFAPTKWLILIVTVIYVVLELVAMWMESPR